MAIHDSKENPGCADKRSYILYLKCRTSCKEKLHRAIIREFKEFFVRSGWSG
jgi:hypothetical protein